MSVGKRRNQGENLKFYSSVSTETIQDVKIYETL